jgi:serine protease AprX
MKFTRKFTPAILAAVLSVGAITGGLVGVFPGTANAACDGRPIDALTATMPSVAEAMNAPAAWNAGFDGRGIDVAVIDTGVSPVPGLASPGKIVDAADFSTDAAMLSYRDGQGHGTNMAGVIAGDGTGGPLSKGIAPGARIINVRAGAADGSVDASQVVAAIDWTVQNRNTFGRNIRVINLSYTTDAVTDYQFDPLTHAVENAWRAGIVVVVSGGNEGKKVEQLGNPAADPFVIAVAASTSDRAAKKFVVPDWSSSGNKNRTPDILAPGVSVAGLRVPGSMLDLHFPAARFSDSNCGRFFRGSGTSQAAAAVSGAVALVLQQRPNLTPDQVKTLMLGTARDIGAKTNRGGFGFVDIAAMIATPTADPVVSTQKFKGSKGSGSIEASRGSVHVKKKSKADLLGEATLASSFDSASWSAASSAGTAWSNQVYDKQGRFLSGTWAGSSWSGSSWSGSSWSGSSWSGSSWSGSSWSGSSWSGAGWD